MMVMPANHSASIVHYWAGKYPGRIGWLVGPSALPKTKLRSWLPFALDNDAYSAWSQKRDWDESAWLALLRSMTELKPMWALVPDVVANREATLERWDKYAPVVKAFGFKLAFAVQDGMTPDDVPQDADLVFVGGTTDWKWDNVKMWTSHFPRVHVGRVNGIERLWECEALRVESVDGTGWFRDSDGRGKALKLKRWMEGEKAPVKPLEVEAAK